MTDNMTLERLDRITSPDYLKHLEPGVLRLVVRRVREYVDHERARSESAESSLHKLRARAESVSHNADAYKRQCVRLRARAERAERIAAFWENEAKARGATGDERAVAQPDGLPRSRGGVLHFPGAEGMLAELDATSEEPSP